MLIDASRRRGAVRYRGRNGRLPASKGIHHADDRLFPPRRPLRSRRDSRNLDAQDFVPLRDRSGKQPDYRILVGKREIGGAWSRTSNNGGEYLFLKLADPSQPAPVCCNLYRNASGPAVLWTR